MKALIVDNVTEFTIDSKLTLRQMGAQEGDLIFVKADHPPFCYAAMRVHEDSLVPAVGMGNETMVQFIILKPSKKLIV